MNSEEPGDHVTGREPNLDNGSPGAEAEGRRIAAFFDLDGTLLSVNSGALWVKSEYRKGRLTTWQVLQAAFYILGYRFGAVNMDAAMSKAVSTVRGLPEQLLRERTREWFEDEVVMYLTRSARRAVEEHRDQGHALVLLTSSSPYESALVVDELNLDASLNCHYEVDDGIMTGRPVFPLCYGAGKTTYARSFSDERGISIEHSYFYTDSYTDLPMLEEVAHPRVVNPDPRLAREAKRRGWPILDWTDDESSETPAARPTQNVASNDNDVSR